MELLLKVFEIVGLCVGAGGAFIFNSFFLLCLKDHQLKKHEILALSRISLLSLSATILSLVSFILMVGLSLEQQIVPNLAITGLELALYFLALVTGLTLRKIHIPSLVRHQYEYSHLSPHFAFHQNSLASTASYSSMAWIFIIILSSANQEQGRLLTLISENILVFSLSFIVLSYIASKISIYIKNVLLSTT